MTDGQKVQTLDEFCRQPREVIDSVGHTGQVSVITDHGEACAVVLPPSVFYSLTKEVILARDVATIRLLQRADQAEGGDANRFFAELDQRLVLFNDEFRRSSPVEVVKARFRIKIAKFLNNRCAMAVLGEREARAYAVVRFLQKIGHAIGRVMNAQIRL